jgi:hypothetical protein
VREERRPHGGDRRSEAAQASFAGYTASALAEIFCVNEATIRRDAELAGAVEQIVKHCGAEVRALLGWEARLNRRTILDLSKREPAEQRLLSKLKWDKKLPRGWRNGGEAVTISLPRELQARAKMIVKREGVGAAATLARLLVEAVNGGSREGVRATSSEPSENGVQGAATEGREG